MREEIIPYKKRCTDQWLFFSRFEALSIYHFNKSFDIFFIRHFLGNSEMSSFKDGGYVRKTKPALIQFRRRFKQRKDRFMFETKT